MAQGQPQTKSAKPYLRNTQSKKKKKKKKKAKDLQPKRGRTPIQCE
jgi:hypothetical protein